MSAADRNHTPQRYQVLDRIAVGGMAEVYRAKVVGAHGFEKTVAIKRIRPHLLKQAEFIDRFIAEAKIAVELNHANIVQVLDFGRDADSLYIAMEYVDGPDVAQLIDTYREVGEAIPIGAAMHISIELFKGLEFAHKREVVHRDISHSNILLSMAGEVKIADFGIAKAVNSRSSLTMSRRIMGKWRYMSPEQTQGESLDAASDIFSAGVVLHELFSGERLFGGRDIEDIVHNIGNAPIPALSSLRPELPPMIDEIIATTLERDRDKRARRAGRIVEQLTEVCFAARVVPTPSQLAEAVGRAFRELVPTSPGDDEPEAQADDVIAAQLADLGIASSTPSGDTRVTRPAKRPKFPKPADKTTRLQPLAKTQTFVAVEPGDDGIPRWQATEELAVAKPAGQFTAVEAPVDSVVVGAEDHGVATTGRRRWLAAVAVLVIGAGVAVFALRGGDTSPADQQAHGPTDAGAAALAAHDAAASAPIADASTVRVASADAHVDRPTAKRNPVKRTPVKRTPVKRTPVKRTPVKRTPVKRTPSKRPPSKRAPVKPAPKRYGRVWIYPEPWANVYLGGRKVAEAPANVRLPHGRHRIKLVNPIKKLQRTITVTVPGGPYRVKLR